MQRHNLYLTLSQIKLVSETLWSAVHDRIQACNESDPVVINFKTAYSMDTAREFNLPIATAYLYTEDLAGGWTIFQLYRKHENGVDVDSVHHVDLTTFDIDTMQSMVHQIPRTHH